MKFISHRKTDTQQRTLNVTHILPVTRAYASLLNPHSSLNTYETKRERFFPQKRMKMQTHSFFPLHNFSALVLFYVQSVFEFFLRRPSQRDQDLSRKPVGKKRDTIHEYLNEDISFDGERI